MLQSLDFVFIFSSVELPSISSDVISSTPDTDTDGPSQELISSTPDRQVTCLLCVYRLVYQKNIHVYACLHVHKLRKNTYSLNYIFSVHE